MNKIKCITLVAFVLGSATTFAAKDSTFHVQNSLRVGYDDNIYQSREGNQQETAFIADIINISGDADFSQRTSLEYFWQPEFRYRFDADPKFVTYQDLYARLSHALSQRTFLELSDRFRYQDKGGQSDLPGSSQDQNYLENDLMGSLSYVLNTLSQIKVGAGYEFRTWDDDNYGKWTFNPDFLGGRYVGGNNYDNIRADGSYIRELKADTTHGYLGANYMNLKYDGNRGGFDSTTLYGGLDHNFNPKVLGTAQLGYSFSSVESGDASTGASGSSEDTSAPFLQLALDYSSTDRTTFTGSLGYSLSQSQNSIYNAADAFDVSLGVQHDLTGKISLSSTLAYIFSTYDSNYSAYGFGDAEEDFFRFSLRGSYQINRNNFVDLGYEFSLRDSDSVFLQEYNRNRVDFGWRLRL
jgi:hypothetical protein